MEGMGIGFAYASGQIVIAVLCGLMAHMTRLGQLERNGVIGLRTKATKSSDRAWQVGHDAARPMLLLTSITAAATAVVLIAAGGLHDDPNAQNAVPTWSLIVGYAVVVLLLTAAGVVADRAAKGASK